MLFCLECGCNPYGSEGTEWWNKKKENTTSLHVIPVPCCTCLAGYVGEKCNECASDYFFMAPECYGMNFVHDTSADQKLFPFSM